MTIIRRTGQWATEPRPQRTLTVAEADRRLAALARRGASREPLTDAGAVRRRLGYLRPRGGTEHRTLVYRQCPYCGNAAEWQGGGSAGAGTPFCTKCGCNLFVRTGDGNDRIPVEQLRNGADIW